MLSKWEQQRGNAEVPEACNVALCMMHNTSALDPVRTVNMSSHGLHHNDSPASWISIDVPLRSELLSLHARDQLL